MVVFLFDIGLINDLTTTRLLKRGCRIALRAKVNDSLICGLRVVDSILPVGRLRSTVKFRSSTGFIGLY